MVDFNATWAEITAEIRSLHIALGVAEDNIIRAAFEQGVMLTPPYVLVGCVPGDWTASVGGRPLETRATAEVFCVTSGGSCNADRIATATEMAAIVLKHFLSKEWHGLQIGPQPIILDTVEAMFTATNVQFSVPYTL